MNHVEIINLASKTMSGSCLYQFFKLPATTTLAELSDAGEHYCGEDWTKLQEKHSGLGEKDLLKYCFSTAYIVALMHDSLGIGMHDERYVGILFLLFSSFCQRLCCIPYPKIYTTTTISICLYQLPSITLLSHTLC